jgi:hypothetical protein
MAVICLLRHPMVQRVTNARISQPRCHHRSIGFLNSVRHIWDRRCIFHAAIRTLPLQLIKWCDQLGAMSTCQFRSPHTRGKDLLGTTHTFFFFETMQSCTIFVLALTVITTSIWKKGLYEGYLVDFLCKSASFQDFSMTPYDRGEVVWVWDFGWSTIYSRESSVMLKKNVSSVHFRLPLGPAHYIPYHT